MMKLAGRTVAAGLVAAAVIGVGTAESTDYGDIVMDRKSTHAGVPAVVFPHWVHRAQFGCYACHPSVFELEKGANDITMDAMRDGEFCGHCHQGRIAFAIGFETCRNCHSGAGP